MIPTILIYDCPEAPPHLRFTGRFLSGAGLQPICFTGPEADAVRGQMTRWWEAEAAKLNRPKRTPPGRASAPAAPALDTDGW